MCGWAAPSSATARPPPEEMAGGGDDGLWQAGAELGAKGTLGPAVATPAPDGNRVDVPHIRWTRGVPSTRSEEMGRRARPKVLSMHLVATWETDRQSQRAHRPRPSCPRAGEAGEHIIPIPRRLRSRCPSALDQTTGPRLPSPPPRAHSKADAEDLWRIDVLRLDVAAVHSYRNRLPRRSHRLAV